ncbi:ABC transporter permease [Kribbella sandramycini]|uniref:Transport permease protein n=1 Tax=Kribbella sandramycini TaxID=60450 RepID=A0A7Y4P2T0_9ACTN|nr:ABC transporter permease [Kribbella sandramycini]MBB6571193.1 ABC-2 type transport system permease protein [Kribbella sandramycini]NOL43400.1 ABC transporter permease [Kribbella sandramycini]
MSHHSVAAALSDTATMIDRSVRLARRNVDTVFVSILLPVLMMALFVYVFGGAINTGTAYINYVVPGILLLTTGYGAATTAMAVADDMNSGMIDRLRSLPIRSFAVLTGHVAASVARNALSTTLVILASFAMGFRPNATAGDWLAAIGLLLLYVVALSWLAAGLGVVARSVESASTLSFFMLFLPYLSSAFVQPGTMPSWLQPISAHQPITYVVEAVRGFLTGVPVGNSATFALAWCVGLLVFSVALASSLYRQRTRR